MSQHNGFTLLELLIYILFFTFVVVATASFAVSLFCAVKARNTKQEQLIMLHTAHDLLVRDLHHAPAERRRWKEIQPDCLIWSTQQKDVGWQWEHKQLVRSEGRYNRKKKLWSAQTKNLIVAHVDAIQFTCVGDMDIRQVRFSITVGNSRVTGVAAPLWRKLL